MVKELTINGTPTKYHVTSNGDVLYDGKVMATYHCRKGYRRVKLVVNSERKAYNVARLIAATFIGIAPDGIQVNHKDRNKQNDSVSNLEYVTNRENTIHAIDKTKTSSKYTNVYMTPSGKWRAWCRVHGVFKSIGLHKTELEAYKAYLKHMAFYSLSKNAAMRSMAQ